MLLHGLTATRRYVVMGSKNLERGGHRVVAYDARGHGRSDRPAPEYSYDALAGDLLAVLDDRGIDRAVLAGASMGAHTLMRLALDHPERAAALVVITPAFEPGGERDLERWDALARGLREGGVDGFIAAYGEPDVPETFRDTIRTVLRQRLSAHEHPEAVADALRRCRARTRSASWDELARARPRRRSWRAATRPIPGTRTRSGSATPRRSRARGWSSRSRASPRSPGREGSSRSVIAETAEKV